MKRSRLLLAIWLGVVAPAALAAERADLILLNGRIITVDSRFSIAQAVAIRGGRILAVGSNADVLELQGSGTRLIDLKKRTVIPGLIDNGAHFIRASGRGELRLDGVTSHRQALAMLAERARAARPGEWIVTLGGWSEDQFADEPRGFARSELDAAAPDNPVVLQAVDNRAFLNTAALKAAGIDAAASDTPGGTIEKDAGGNPTGVVSGAGGVAFVVAKIPPPDDERRLANARGFVAGLNAMGITAWCDSGGPGVTEGDYRAYRTLAGRGELNARVFWMNTRQAATPAEVDGVLAAIRQLTPFQGDDAFDNIGWGGSLYGPAAASAPGGDFVARPEDMGEVRRMVQALAERGVYLNAPVATQNAIDAYLDAYEAVSKVAPVKGLRWAFSHLDQVNDAQLERMKRLGMYAALDGRPLVQGALMQKAYGERAWEMPPFRRVQNSGIRWGLGSDATVADTINPFYTLWFAVTGRMVGGRVVNRQTVTREEALIAHTRANAFFVFQEDNIGAIQAGKYADLIVLDRDYFRVPADQIKDIKPLMTMVGGKIVYQKGNF